MLKKFSEYTKIFFWDFKRMDNVNYNFDILNSLCDARRGALNKSHFNRPILLQIVAIIECIIYDFIRRVNDHRKEIILNIDQVVIDDTRVKVLDYLSPLIAHIKKNDLLRICHGDKIYDDLDNLRKIRNRVHIENHQQQLDKDEYNVWTDYNVKLAGETLGRIVEVLCHVYPRPNRDFVSMIFFPKPWL